MGRALLADVARRALRVSSEVSARLIVVHAISQSAEAFYLRHGFTRLPIEAPTLDRVVAAASRWCLGVYGSKAAP